MLDIKQVKEYLKEKAKKNKRGTLNRRDGTTKTQKKIKTDGKEY